MKNITANLIENKNELLVVVFIQMATALGCYLAIPQFFN